MSVSVVISNILRWPKKTIFLHQHSIFWVVCPLNDINNQPFGKLVQYMIPTVNMSIHLHVKQYQPLVC